MLIRCRVDLAPAAVKKAKTKVSEIQAVIDESARRRAASKFKLTTANWEIRWQGFDGTYRAGNFLSGAKVVAAVRPSDLGSSRLGSHMVLKQRIFPWKQPDLPAATSLRSHDSKLWNICRSIESN